MQQQQQQTLVLVCNEILFSRKFIGALQIHNILTVPNSEQVQGWWSGEFKNVFAKLNYHGKPRCFGESFSSQIKPTTAAATAKGSSPFPPPSLQGPNNLYVRSVAAVMCIWQEGASLIRGQAPGNIPPYNIGAHTRTVMLAKRERDRK